MMFYLNRKVDSHDEYIIHSSCCDYLPLVDNRIDLGELYSCESALERAKELYDNSNGCIHCCSLCHEVPVSIEDKDLANKEKIN